MRSEGSSSTTSTVGPAVARTGECEFWLIRASPSTSRRRNSIRPCSLAAQKTALCADLCLSVRTSFEGSAVSSLEVVNGVHPAERLEELLRMWLSELRPTSGCRQRAWREFQRALDPLAAPKRLPLWRA